MRIILSLCAAAALLGATSARAQVAYDANTTTGSDGAFTSTANHYLQQVTLAGPNTPQSLNALPAFGLRWNDVSLGNRTVMFRFWIGVDTSAGAANALANATLENSISFTLTPPPTSQSLTYNLPLGGLTVSTNSFWVEISFLSADGSSFITQAELAGRLTTGSPSVGFNDGFLYQDDDGILAGSERGQVNGSVSGTPVLTNYRLSIDATGIPEPTTAALLAGAGLVALGLVRRRR